MLKLDSKVIFIFILIFSRTGLCANTVRRIGILIIVVDKWVYSLKDRSRTIDSRLGQIELDKK